MRIDPEAVYLELLPVAHIHNFTTHDTQHVPAVTLHFKDGRKWHRSTFPARDGATMGDVLATIGKWLDSCGDLDSALAQVTEARP